jgi:hypothetical protein
MGFVSYLKSLLGKNVFDDENYLKEIENNKREGRLVNSKKNDELKSGSKMKSSNLVSTTTTTIINKKKVSQIVKSSYVKNNTKRHPHSYRLYRIASPIAESSCLYSQASNQRRLELKIKAKRSPIVHFHKDTLNNKAGNGFMKAQTRLSHCKKREKYNYSSYMQCEIIKNNLTCGNKFKIKKKKRRIGDLKASEKRNIDFIKSNQAPPCCLVNGKPLNFKKSSTSFFELKSMREHRNEKKIKQRFERVHLKKSNAMSDIKRIDYFTSNFFQNYFCKKTKILFFLL